MTQFWKENKWYVLAVLFTMFAAVLYLWFSDGSQNLLPEVYSVM